MKAFKRTVSVFLAALMLLGSISVFATIGDGAKRTLTSQVRFYREDGNGEWVETTKVAKGDQIEARIILESDFIVGAHVLYYLYSNDIFEIDTSRQTSDTLITYDFDQRNGTIYWDDQNSALTNDMINYGYLDSNIANDWGSVYIYVDGGLSSYFDGIEEVYSVYFKVKEDAPADAVATMFIPPESRRVMRSTDPNFPHLYTYASRAIVETELGKDVGAFDGNNPQDWEAEFEIYNLPSTNLQTVAAAQGDTAATVEENTNVTYNNGSTTTSSYVTLGPDVPVTFNVTGDDNFSETVDIPFGNAIAGKEPAYDAPFGYAFAGWPKNNAGKTVDDNGNAQATEIVNGQTVTGSISPKSVTATFYTPAGLTNDGILDLSEVDPSEESGIDSVRWKKTSGSAAVRRRAESVEFEFGEAALAQPFGWDYMDLDTDNYYFRGWAVTGNPEDEFDGEDTFFTPTASMQVYGVYDEDNLISTIDTTTIPESAYIDDGEGGLLLYLLPVFAPIPTENFTVKWNAKDVNNNTIAIDDQSVVANTVIAAADVPSVPEVTGYDFVWYSDENYATKAVWPYTVTADTEFYGRYELQEYKLTVNYYDSRDYNEQNPSEPGHSNPIFDQTDVGGSNPAYLNEHVPFDKPLVDLFTPAEFTHYELNTEKTVIPQKMPAADTVVNVFYDVHTNDITYYSTEDATGDPLEVMDDIAYHDEIEITGEDDPVKEGYDFVGWKFSYTENGNTVTFNSTDDDFDEKFMPDAAVTATPIFRIIKSKLTVNYVDAEGNAINGVESVVYDGDDAIAFGTDLAGLVEIKTVAHYTYDADATNIPPTMPAVETTVNVVYNINTNSITYYSTEDGTGDPLDVLTDIPYGGEIEITSEDEPTKEGYDFAGWKFSYVDPETGDTVTFNSEDNDFDTRTMPDAAVTAVPTFEVQEYTLTIYDGDNTEITTKQVEYGADIEIPDTVTVTAPEGHHFTGNWEFYKKGETAAYTGTTMPAADVDAIPVCDANTYTINFVTNVDGYAITPIEAAYGEDITAPVVDNAQNPGHAFAGWFTDNVTFNDAYTIPATMPAVGPNNGDSITVYAKWTDADTTFTINVYTMDVDGNYGTPDVKTGSGTTNATLTRAELLAQAAVTIGEGFELNETTTPADFQVPAQDGVYNIYIDRVKATYTIDLAGGTLAGDYTPSGEYYYGATITAPSADPEKNGNFEFDGWDNTFPATMPANDVTITAEYKHYTNFKFMDPTEDTVKKYDGETFTRDTYNGVVEDGYTFVGWSTTENDVPANAVTSFTASADVDNVIYFPVFEAETFTVTYKLLPPNETDDNAQWADGTTADIVITDVPVDGQMPAAPTGAIRDGYEQIGWLGESVYNQQVVQYTSVPEIMDVPGDYTFWVQWTPAEYTITFMAIDTATGEYAEFETIDVEFNTPYDEWEFPGEPDDPDGYKVRVVEYDDDMEDVDWNTEQDGSGKTPVQIGAMPARDLVFYAQYDILSFDLTVVYVDEDNNALLDADGNAINGTEETKEYKAAVDTTAPVFSGYEYKSTDITPALGENNTMPASDVTVTYTYKKLNFTITYVTPNGATQIPVAEYAYMDAVTAPDDPDLPGNEFQGWYLEDTFDTPATIPANMPAENLTFYAKFGTNTITLTFDANGGKFGDNTATKEVSGSYGQEIPAVAAPEQEGYTFDGWDPALPQDNKFPAQNATYVAQWTVNPHTVTYKVDGSSVFDAQVNFGGDVAATVPADPTKDGYQFTGWKDADGHDPAYYATMPDKDLVFEAQFTSLNVYVKYIVDGEEISFAAVPYSNGSITVKTVDDVAEWHYGAEDGTVYAPGATYTFTVDDVTNGITFYGVTEETETVTATFNPDGGKFEDNTTEPKEVETVKGAVPVAPADPTKTGYDFKGWSPAVGSITEDTTYTAVWQAKPASVTYKDENGEVIETFPQAYGEEIETPSDPEKEGYTFKEWAYTDINGDPYTGTTVPEGGLNATPVYEINKYQFTVDLNGGSLADGATDPSGEKEYNAAIAVPEVTREGYSLDATTPWKYYKVENGTETELDTAPATMPAYDVKAVANWVVNTYKIFLFYTENGQPVEIETITAEYGADVVVTADPNTRPGYAFSGWAEAIPATMGAYDAPDYENNTKEIEALYNVLPYTVTVDLDGGEYPEGTTDPAGDYDYGTEFPNFTAIRPTKEGWGFSGWEYYKVVDGNKTKLDSAPATMPAYDVEVKATWGVEKYEFIVDLNGGSLKNGEVMPETPVEYGADLDPLPEVEQVGYNFTGWKYYKVTTTEEEINSLPAQMPAYNLKAVAQWTINQYTITFDSNGGTAVDPITQDYNTDVTAPADPTKEGYTFNGWTPAVPEKMPAENITVVAQWTINQYTITFDTDGGTAIPAITQDYNTDVTAPADPTKTGYTFAGWDKTIPSKMPAENVTITALWTINQYTITFDSNGGTAVDPITQNYNTDVTAPADPTKEGYTFNGWNPAVPEKMPAENITVVAQWTINQYTITFDSNGGTAIDPITQDYNTDVTAPADPTKEGYTFNGWSPAVPEKMPAENRTVVAQWTINKYQFTVDLNNGSLADGATDPSGEVVYGAAVPAVPEVDKEGNELDATTPWKYYKVENGTETELDAAPATMPAYDVKAVANWVVNKYQLTIDLDDGAYAAGVEDKAGEYEFGATFPTLPTGENDVVKADSTFSGWKYYKVENGTETEISKPDTMPAYDVKAVAQYGDVEYTITFDSQGGSAVESITAIKGAAITAPADPTKEGFKFGGWYTDADCTDGNEYTVPPTMPSGSITVYAKWNAIVKLVAKEGTTTMVQRVNVVESYQTPDAMISGVSRVIPVDKLTYDYNADNVDYYIYGLKTGIAADGGLDAWVEVTGNGTYEVDASTVAATGKVGTGTVVNVYDADHNLVESFKIIIFGDVDGNGRITNADTVAVNNEITEPRVWSVEGTDNYDICKVRAADLDQNNNVSTDDYVAFTDYMLRKVNINQVTGRYE